MFKAITIQEFRKKFSTNADCMNYLVELKWGNGYTCRRCGHQQPIKGRQWFYKRCQRCKHDESATSGTLFDGVKMPLLKVFELVYRISVRKKGMSSCELAKELGCQQKTAWQWKAKFQQAMKSSEQNDLEGLVEVDEFLVGGFEADAPGRTHGKKSLVVLAVEKVVDKKGNETLGRAYAKPIDDGSAESLKAIFEKHISTTAAITTDGWRGYLPLIGDWEITQEPSSKGENFKLLHMHIMNIKGWLRGIHHKCSSQRLKDYLNEYNFRFNRRNFLHSIWSKVLERAMAIKPCPYAQCEAFT